LNEQQVLCKTYKIEINFVFFILLLLFNSRIHQKASGLKGDEAQIQGAQFSKQMGKANRPKSKNLRIYFRPGNRPKSKQVKQNERRVDDTTNK
jgi:hypothetical protein